MHPSTAPPREPPPWLLEEPYDEISLGTLKSGKEAEVFLLERRYERAARASSPTSDTARAAPASASCATSASRSRPATGAMPCIGPAGSCRAATAERVAHKTDHGHEVIGADLWPIQEMAMLELAWASGASVPYPVERSEDGSLMEFIGDVRVVAAPTPGAGAPVAGRGWDRPGSSCWRASAR